MSWCQDSVAFWIKCQHTTWWYDMQMVMHDKKHVFLFLSTRNQNVEIKILECMIKNLLCSAFLKFCFFMLCPLSSHQTYCYGERRMKFEVFWNGVFKKKVMIAREKWQGVQTLVSMFLKRRNKVSKPWHSVKSLT